nr:MinD/ParA family protein [Microbacterium sp. SS28]
MLDTGAIDTTGLGILGGSTEQVSVALPGNVEEDIIDDDDVIVDEVEVFEIMPADGDDELDAAPLESTAGDLAEFESSLRADDPAEDVVAEDVADDIVDAEEIDAEPLAAAADADLTESTVEAEIVTEQASSDRDQTWASLPPASAPGTEAVPTTTGSIPATRREAHAESVERTDRAQALERTPVRPDVRPDLTLTSKRLGEFEPGRESADLLTADRLLDPHQVVRPEPEGAWQHFVYSLTGHRLNLGDGKRARARKELDRRIAAPLGAGARFVPVVSRKGGVGKTTITTLLGMALADARDDRVIAVDANPDRGTLADRIARQNGKTVRDLVRDRAEISGYAGISSVVARDDTRLDVLASDADPRVSEAFSDRDYRDVATLAAHYYSIVLTDTGTGIVHSVMQATLELADQLVVVAGLSVDEARLASETLTWLETNGYSEQVRNAVVVLNTARPGTPLVRPEELETHFRTRVRAVVRMPYDPHIAAGSAITFRDLRPETRLAARELAACVVEGLRTLASAA